MSRGGQEGLVALGPEVLEPSSGSPVTSRIARRAADADSARALRRRALSVPASLFVGSRLLLVVLAAVVPLQPGQAALGWFQRLVGVGDAGWYESIAGGGYAHVPFNVLHPVQENWAFFPLFPVTARVISHLLGVSVFWTGLVIDNACFLGFLAFLYWWMARDWGESTARAATLLAAVCPVAAYFTAFRAESMFVLLTAVCLERLLQRRMALAAVAGALATVCEPAGLLLALPYLVACAGLLRERRDRLAVRSLFYAPLFATGVITMALVSKADSGSWLAFEKVQAAWGRAFRLPFFPFATFFEHPVATSDWGWSSPPVAMAATLLGLVGTWYLWKRRLPWELTVYLGATVLGASASTLTLGVARFVADAVPLYIAAALVPRRWLVALASASLIALIVYTVYWLLGSNWAMG